MAGQRTANTLNMAPRVDLATSETTPGAVIRAPVVEDGVSIADLIARCAPLDRNSLYATLLLCTHFSTTCAAAFRANRLAGWVSAYRPPAERDVLFVWQVAITPEWRGRGLARRIIANILARPACADVRRIQTTITTDNSASWSLFRSVADKVGARIYAEPHFLRGAHFGGDHETEHLVTIGPFEPSAFCGDN